MMLRTSSPGHSQALVPGLARAFEGRLPPQNPGGTRSQAWSVAETLRALDEHAPLK